MEEVEGEVVAGAGVGAEARVKGEVDHGAKVAHEAEAKATAGTDAAGAEGGQRVEQGAKVEREAGVGVTVTARKKAVQRVGLENLEAAAVNGVIIKKKGRKRGKVPVRCMLVSRLMVRQLEG